MGYNLNPPNNLRITAQSRTFCVGVAETMVGTTIGAFELRGAEWIAIWLEPPDLDPAIRDRINAEGGMRNFMQRIADAINKAIRELFGTSAPPVASGNSATADLINEINTNWAIVLGTDGVPVFRRK